VKVRLRWNIL